MLTLQDKPDTASEETRRLLQAAEGWAFFGLYKDAFAELESIPQKEIFLREVLIAKVRVLLRLEKWQVAERLACVGMDRYQNEDEFPVQRVFALMKAKLYQRAESVMANVPQWIMRTGIIHYNLACYFLNFLGDKKLGAHYVNEAVSRNANIKKNAKKDPDLKVLWT